MSSSAGSILQLVAKGEEDKLLSEAPEMSIFKSVYKRFTHFAEEVVDLPYNEGSKEFVSRKLTCTIPKRADLLGKLYFDIELPALTIPSGSTYVHWTNSLGFAMIKDVQIEIGGYVIDKHYGEWMYIWHELVTKIPTNEDDPMTGGYSTVAGIKKNAEAVNHIRAPLYFWFCNNPALYLPLVALQYHEVKVSVTIRDFLECVCYDGSTAPDRVEFLDMALTANFVYLEENTRKNMAQSEHVFLIEQLQRSNYEGVKAGVENVTMDLTLNHPIKELFWFFRETDSEENNDWLNFTTRVPLYSLMYPLFTKVSMYLDGKERLSDFRENYFREAQKVAHHSMMSLDYGCIYSFSHTPEDHLQPSGSCNFSRISSAQMKFKMDTRSSVPATNFALFGVNYNYLIIKSGQANLFYKA